MSGWRRCEKCRKVRTGAEFEGGAAICQVCLTAPVPVVRKRTAAVVRTQSAPREVTSVPRRPLLGAVGSGDLEVRERRARRAAQEALAESHPEEYRLLLRDARQAEGLRPMDTGGAPTPPEAG